MNNVTIQGTIVVPMDTNTGMFVVMSSTTIAHSYVNCKAHDPLIPGIALLQAKDEIIIEGALAMRSNPAAGGVYVGHVYVTKAHAIKPAARAKDANRILDSAAQEYDYGALRYDAIKQDRQRIASELQRARTEVAAALEAKQQKDQEMALLQDRIRTQISDALLGGNR